VAVLLGSCGPERGVACPYGTRRQTLAHLDAFALMHPAHRPSAGIPPGWIKSGIYLKYLVGPSIRQIYTRYCFTMTNMMQLCSNYRRGQVFIKPRFDQPRETPKNGPKNAELGGRQRPRGGSCALPAEHPWCCVVRSISLVFCGEGCAEVPLRRGCPWCCVHQGCLGVVW